MAVVIQELKEEAEVRWIAFVGRRRQEQEMVAALAQQLSEPVALTLVLGVCSRHAMGFIYDDEVPMDLFQSRQDVRSFGEVQGSEDLLVFNPLVDAELVADGVAPDDMELLVELLHQFALPLEGQIRRTDDEDALCQATKLQFADEEPGHDGLARTGVVGQEESDA